MFMAKDVAYVGCLTRISLHIHPMRRILNLISLRFGHLYHTVFNGLVRVPGYRGRVCSMDMWHFFEKVVEDAKNQPHFINNLL